jgi:hypothetical protein
MPVDQPGGSEGAVIVAVSSGYKGGVAPRANENGPDFATAGILAEPRRSRVGGDLNQLSIIARTPASLAAFGAWCS